MAFNGVKVLIVDDEQVVRETLFYILRQRGFDAEVAESGMEAMEKIALRTPDVIILDFSMPEMDGLETHNKLRENPRTRDIPIIFFSGHNQAPVPEKMPGQTTIFFRKPFEIESLIKSLSGYGPRPSS